MHLIEPALGLKLVIWGGWLLAAIGVLKVLIFFIGELVPGAYSRIKSESVRRFMTGNANRLIFGLLGGLTVLLGLIFVFLGVLLSRFSDRL